MTLRPISRADGAYVRQHESSKMFRRFSEHIESKIFTELELFDDRKERRLALRKAMAGTMFSWQMLLLFPAITVGAIILRQFVEAKTDFPRLLLAGLLGAAIAITGTISLQVLSARTIKRRLRRQLCKKGVPICINCGYVLVGLDTNRCPECGVGFAPSEPD